MPRAHYVALVIRVFLIAPSAVIGQTLTAPAQVMMDESFIVAGRGLAPGAHATLRATMLDSAGRTWVSQATFEANAKGQISTADAPVSGDYNGPHTMGIIWSMDVEGKPGNLRYSAPSFAHVPLTLSLIVDGRTVKSIIVDRRFTRPGVERVEAASDTGIVWSIFRPKSAKPRAAILVLGGSEGGNSAEDIAATLASHGYTAASLAYFNAAGLPGELKEIPLEYFQRAISMLVSPRFSRSGRIAILGTSKGAEAALLLASIDDRIDAVVAYAPSSVAWSCICEEAARSSWTLRGNEVEAIKPGRDPAYRATGPLRPAVNYRYRLLTSTNFADASIKVEQFSGRLMLIAGEDDQLWHSPEMARQLQSRRSASQRGRNDRYLYYPAAGHFIGKLYLPSGSTRIAGGRIETGGSSLANGIAQEDSWKRVLEFLGSALASN